jgi:hypothetical protein
MKIEGGSADIEVFISEGGYLCFKQSDYPNLENIIFVHPHQFQQLKAAIERTLAGTKEGFIVCQ